MRLMLIFVNRFLLKYTHVRVSLMRCEMLENKEPL
jgi:hypothetical protein